MPQRIVTVQAVGAGDPGTVYQRIDLVQAGEHGLHGGRVGDVAGDEAMRRVCRRGGQATSTSQSSARQAVRDGSADAPGASGNDRLFHCAVPPPSTGSMTPVMKDAASEARNATAAAISDGSAKRPSGTPDL